MNNLKTPDFLFSFLMGHNMVYTAFPVLPSTPVNYLLDQYIDASRSLQPT